MFDSHSETHRVEVIVTTCMGKCHYFTVPYFTKAYGDTSDKLLFVDYANLSPKLSIEERQNSIVPNTAIPELLKSESCCYISVVSNNCYQTMTLNFKGPFSVNVDNSISYDAVEHHITPSTLPSWHQSD